MVSSQWITWLQSNREVDWKQKILNDLRVELSDEFDRNFQRKAFFNQPWPPRKMGKRGSVLMVTGRLRRSIRSRVTSDSVFWETSEKYAAIHNYGGTIRVTAKMKKFFWYKYKTTKDEEWKWMALMKTGSVITIPQRQFLGDHPEVRKRAEAVVSRNLQRAAQELVKRLV